MVACLLPYNGSLNVIRRSLMPFGNPVSFPTRSDLMANQKMPNQSKKCKGL